MLFSAEEGGSKSHEEAAAGFGGAQVYMMFSWGLRVQDLGFRV